MKTYWIKTTDGRTELEPRELPIPQPAGGEIVLKVHATALNRGELVVGGVMHGGAYKPGGGEAAGTVHAVGDGVQGIQVGDRIMGRVKSPGGGFGEYVAMRTDQAMRIPERLSFEQAASIPVTWLVTYDMLYPYGKLKKGEWLLALGASSGVGVSVIQMGKYVGAKVIGTSGSARKLEQLKTLGMDAGIATRTADFSARVNEITAGHGADLIVNSVGGSVFAEGIRTLAHKGRLATVGYVDGVLKAEIDLNKLHAQRLEVFGVSNSRLSLEDKAQCVRDFSRDVLPGFADGRIVPYIDRIFPFDQISTAKAYMESNAQVGKIVIRVA
jgi:NADPH:quinone reductase-like Zn-dependent oxidoreductase